MFAVRVPVVDVDFQGPVVVPVAEVHHLDAERLPGGVQVVLDDFALVHNGKLIGGKTRLGPILYSGMPKSGLVRISDDQ